MRTTSTLYATGWRQANFKNFTAPNPIRGEDLNPGTPTLIKSFTAPNHIHGEDLNGSHYATLQTVEGRTYWTLYVHRNGHGEYVDGGVENDLDLAGNAAYYAYRYFAT